MPEDLPIKITRSSGGSWPYRFGPSPPDAPGNINPDAVAQGVEDVLKQIGPSGQNAAAGSLNALSDVVIMNTQNGDVLRYENNKWRNYNEQQLTDGGNF